jgi:V/A-type H+-transporting ATPase subunit B
MRPEIIASGNATRIEGPLMFLRRTISVGLNEAVVVIVGDSDHRLGRIAALDEDFITVEVLESTQGLSLQQTRVRFLGEPLHFGVGPDILGRVFNGIGEVIDGGPPVSVQRYFRTDGLAINPVQRAMPSDFIETGISSLDLMNALVRGQKLPIFSGGGLPHDRLAVEIASQARLPGEEEASFVVVFVGIGVPRDTAERFHSGMEDTGAIERSVLFLNLASDSSVQRLLTPRFALTAAEYLAFVAGYHVLVIMTDMTNYCEALREVSSSHGEVPSRKGYPGYMYSDLASLYERAGCVQDLPGTLTQVPILTMPADDISHPIPDLTGYITEGQIMLDRALHRRDIYPPCNVLPSLSRLMKDGIGEGYTHRDHPALASQLYAAYARVAQIRLLANVVGIEGLTEIDRTYLNFGDRFEHTLINQDSRRSLETSMEIGWDLLRLLPVSELHRLSDEQIRARLRG